MTVLFLTEGFNESETFSFIEKLRKKNVNVKTVGLDGKTVSGACGIPVVCDAVASEIDLEDIKLAILPLGDPKVLKLNKSPVVSKLINLFATNEGSLEAICTADFALERLGLSETYNDDEEEETESDLFDEQSEESLDLFSMRENRLSSFVFTPIPERPDYSNYEFPSTELMAKDEPLSDPYSDTEIQEYADKIIDTLSAFGVTASINGVDRGPRITRFYLVPAKGVKFSSISNLADDIMINLAAGSIRMETPIPGHSAIGIEIPNKHANAVHLRDLIESEEFKNAESKTSVCIGRNIAGEPVVGDIAKMPHVLVAGAAGMGKSVCMNNIIASVLYKAKPDEVKFILIDPKQVEFIVYNDMPHLLCPVITENTEAVGALTYAVAEMERRYSLLNNSGVRNIDAYNEKIKNNAESCEPIPKIVIVIDELSDLMISQKDSAEMLIMRLAQKARAAGIYLIIGTQRPSASVLTGVIRANIPSRISCKVMSNVDSKNILDTPGAEKLLDRGDMLYAPAGSIKPYRVQGAIVSDDEISAIVEHIKTSCGNAQYDSEIINEIKNSAAMQKKKRSSKKQADNEQDGGYLSDKQFLDAVEIAVNAGKISTPLLQRKLSIGFGKAVKFIDIMEDLGIVDVPNGQHPRVVLLTPEEWHEKLARATADET